MLARRNSFTASEAVVLNMKAREMADEAASAQAECARSGHAEAQRNEAMSVGNVISRLACMPTAMNNLLSEMSSMLSNVVCYSAQVSAQAISA